MSKGDWTAVQLKAALKHWHLTFFYFFLLSLLHVLDRGRSIYRPILMKLWNIKRKKW